MSLRCAEYLWNAEPTWKLLLGAVTMLLYGEIPLLHLHPHLFPKDYIVTFEDEVNFVWRVAPRFSMAKLLFFAVGHVTVEW